MISLLIWTMLVLPLAYLLSTCFSLAKNIRIAKASGIPYVLVPIFSYNRFLMVVSRPILRYIDKVYPNPAATSWRNLIKSNWVWTFRHETFAQFGTDTFLTIAPGGIILYTADADVITQITTRGADFPKPTFLYRSVDIYGKNIVSSEGAAWRYHRKLTSPAFSESNNRLVWEETLEQCQAMLASWLGERGKLNRIHEDAMQLSLSVISRAGLGRKMNWLGSVEEGQRAEEVDIPSGYTMGFTYSLRYLLDHILLVMLMPKWLLCNYPSATFRKAHRSYEDWGRYMKDLITSKRTALHEKGESSAVDILGQLVKGQDLKEDRRSRAFLTDSEVMGNLFMFMIAGHETSANTIHLCVLFLAIHPNIQCQVQSEVDKIFQGRPITKWSYDTDASRLLGGILGAVLYETLRLVPPVITIPKHVASSTPQSLKVDDKILAVPANTMIRLCVPSVHHNPKHWASTTTGNQNGNDLKEFKPERWLIQRHESHDNDNPQLGEAHLLTPSKGAYIPFSDGPRACLGKRFAQVEIVAALAAIFCSHSVELDVNCGDDDAGGNDKMFANMSRDERMRVWERAQQSANATWRDKMTNIISMQLSGEKGRVPLRVVRRGEERFFDL